MLTSRRRLAAATFSAALTLAGLLTVTVTGAQGSTGFAGSPAPTVTPPKSPMPPTAPTGLTATSVKSTSVTLSWTASRGGCCGVDRYDITWNQAFDDIYRLTEAGDVTTFTISENIRPATQYTFRVTALDDVGHRSAASESVTVVTPLSDAAADVTPPQAPSALAIVGQPPGSVTLSWAPSTDDVAVTGYNVYWFDGWFTSRLVTTVSGTTATAALSTGRSVFYVRARDAAGNVSIASNTVTSEISTPPTTSPPRPPVCRVSYERTAQWDRGFVASLTVTNTGPAPVDGWALAFSFAGDERVGSVWNATYTQDGSAVTLRNANWNGSLAPGASRTVGLIGSWTAAGSVPAAFTLNGAPCTTSVT